MRYGLSNWGLDKFWRIRQVWKIPLLSCSSLSEIIFWTKTKTSRIIAVIGRRWLHVDLNVSNGSLRFQIKWHRPVFNWCTCIHRYKCISVVGPNNDNLLICPTFVQVANLWIHQWRFIWSPQCRFWNLWSFRRYSLYPRSHGVTESRSHGPRANQQPSR